jgi:hypothetical protein
VRRVPARAARAQAAVDPTAAAHRRADRADGAADATGAHLDAAAHGLVAEHRSAADSAETRARHAIDPARATRRPIDPASAMNARALAFYRRAEGAQRTGDKAAALLQIKMAIAADPKSTFLRAALLELTKS